MLFFYFKETLETNDSFIKSSHRRQECLRNWVKMREEALFSVKGIQLRHQGSYDTHTKKNSYIKVKHSQKTYLIIKWIT